MTAAQLAERVEQRAGRVLFVPPTQAELFVDGYVARAPRGYSVQLAVSKRDGEVLGERTLEIEGERCDAIDAAITLVIAVTLYPRSSLVATGIPFDQATAASLEALFGDEPTDPDPQSLPTPVIGAPPAVSRAQSQPARTSASFDLPRSASWSFGVDAAAGAGLGGLPDLSTLLALHLRAVAPELWPIELELQRWLSSTAELAGGAGAVDFELLAAALSACPWIVLVPDARLCLGAQVGLLSATPRGLAVSASRSRDATIDATVGLVYRPRLAGALHLRVELVAAVPLIQHSFVFEALDGTPTTAFSSAPVSGRAELGLGLTLTNNRARLRALRETRSALTVSFTDVFAQYGPYVLGLVRRLGVQEREVEDVAQEVFVIVHRQLPAFEGRSTLKTWICGIALRAAANHRRKAYRRHERPDAFLNEPAIAASQEDELDRSRQAAALQRALDGLSDKLRQVFVLYEIEELPMLDVARAVGCPRFTAYTRLRAARSAIAAELMRDARPSDRTLAKAQATR